MRTKDYFCFSPILTCVKFNSRDVFSYVGQKQRLLLHWMTKCHAFKQRWQLILTSRLIAQSYTIPSSCFWDNTNISVHYYTVWTRHISSMILIARDLTFSEQDIAKTTSSHLLILLIVPQVKRTVVIELKLFFSYIFSLQLPNMTWLKPDHVKRMCILI